MTNPEAAVQPADDGRVDRHVRPLVERLRARRMLAMDGLVAGVGRAHAKPMWVTAEPDPDCAAAADEIERLRSAARQWTACDKELPDSGKEVLVWRQPMYRLIGGCHVALSACRYTENGPVWDCDQGYWPLPASLARRVTHWMPKPEGPNDRSQAGAEAEGRSDSPALRG